MREIKFRGREKESNKWVFGYARHWKCCYGDEWHIQGENDNVHIVIPETVGQFTGLKDIEGREIYEGDIVKCGTGRICEVVYFLSPVHAGYDLNPVGGFDCKPPSEFSLWFDLTVIGNVHDNPEILEVKGDA